MNNPTLKGIFWGNGLSLIILYYIVPYISIGIFNNIVPNILCNLFLKNLERAW